MCLFWLLKWEKLKGRNWRLFADFCSFSTGFWKAKGLGVADFRRICRSLQMFAGTRSFFAEAGFPHLVFPLFKGEKPTPKNPPTPINPTENSLGKQFAQTLSAYLLFHLKKKGRTVCTNTSSNSPENCLRKLFLLGWVVFGVGFSPLTFGALLLLLMIPWGFISIFTILGELEGVHFKAHLVKTCNVSS